MTARSSAPLLALAGLAAHSVVPWPALADSPPDACTLLSPAEVSAALGAAVDPGEHLVPSETRFCTWREHGKDPLQASNVRLSLVGESDFDGGKPSALLKASTPESGIGDEAYFSKAAGMVYLLSVRKGGTYFRIQARSSPGAAGKTATAQADRRDQEIERALARTLLAKL